MSKQTLSHLLRSGERIPTAAVMDLIRRLAAALDRSTSTRKEHNLTPAWISVTGPDASGGYEAELIEQVTTGDADHSQSTSAAGGPLPEYAAYLSPEKVLGTPTDLRSDQFSLAVIAYELLSGVKPFQAANLSALFYEICTSEPVAVHRLNPELREDTSAVLSRAMRKDPGQRFAACGVFATSLAASLRGAVFTAAPAASAPTSTATPNRTELPPLPPRRRQIEDEEEDRPSGSRPLSSVQKAGLYALLAFVVIGFAAKFGHWGRSSPLPTQVLDPQTGPSTPPPQTDQPPSPEAASPEPKARPSTPAVTRPVHQPIPSTASPVRAASSGLSHRTEAAPRVTPTSRPTRTPTTRLASTPGQAAVELLTQPAGAALMIDGRNDQTCRTPCTLVLTPGRHVLSASLGGFVAAQRIFHVPEESSLLIPLRESTGAVIVTSVPSGASLMVDGKDAGRTPVTLHLKAGQHRLDAFLGVQARQQIVQVLTDAIQGAQFDLR